MWSQLRCPFVAFFSTALLLISAQVAHLKREQLGCIYGEQLLCSAIMRVMQCNLMCTSRFPRACDAAIFKAQFIQSAINSRLFIIRLHFLLKIFFPY